MKTFNNCYRFTYTATNHDNIILDHRRSSFAHRSDGWISEKRDCYGNILGRSIYTDAEMEHIYNYMCRVAECSYVSMATNADYSPFSV